MKTPTHLLTGYQPSPPRMRFDARSSHKAHLSKVELPIKGGPHLGR